MAQLKIIKADEVPTQNIRGFGEEAGKIRKVVTSSKLFFNIDEICPGFSPHHWHKHDSYVVDGNKVEYPADFEEIYFVLSGHGVVQWKTASGAVEEQAVGCDQSTGNWDGRGLSNLLAKGGAGGVPAFGPIVENFGVD